MLIAAFYHFVSLPNHMELRGTIRKRLQALNAKGTILLAPEGVNGTLSADEGIKDFIAWLCSETGMPERNIKWSESVEHPFKRLKVKLKKETIPLGVPASPVRMTGIHVSPAEWNRIISDPETVVVDTRNDYEVEVGTFKGAIDPRIATFKELPDFIKSNLDYAKQRKVATFCTGGIRCEKLTAWMMEQGFQEVYQLDGGILRYLQETPQEQSLWEGKCFVFDERGAVD